MTMRLSQKLQTDLDRRCEGSLQHILNPEFHGLIQGFMRSAQEREKKGIIKLAEMAEPQLLKSIGRPEPLHHRPQLVDNPYAMPRPGFRPPAYRFMQHSYSDPSFQTYGDLQDAMSLSWQKEEAAEIAQIQKPGGYVVKLKDTIEIQAKKNRQRNKGTFKVTGGAFDGTTTTASFHNLRAIGMDK
mmetsp:Transcript_18584/g.43334  ORF Transcript_18584/g.43334 Transcript_18584/m.43334 type:complete len:185 (-) Transcript_18584:35-589(-)